MTLFEKSLKIVGLDSVLAMLSKLCVCEDAKKAAEEIVPSTEKYDVSELLWQTTEAKKMIELKGNAPFSYITDIRPSLNRADLGGTLNETELLSIARVLKAGASLSDYFGDYDEPSSVLTSTFLLLYKNVYLENKISTSILGPDDIADNASPELADIRRKMRAAGERARAALNKIIASPTYAKYLQESIITVKNDRFVVPVKAEFKSSVPGLVHDVSSSGATVFIEPISSVQANNEIRELIFLEKREIERILAELSADCAVRKEEIARSYKALVELDVIFAKAKLSYSLNSTLPEITDKREVVLNSARHPLLDAKKVVPITVSLGGQFNTLVITGPNTGGKTVTLKTIGLLCAMAQCGLHIPAKDGCELCIFDGILADIGDEQSIEQSLSTFSAHMTTIVKILEECGENTLILFDELGAGTDPTEGAALAIAIIENARNRGALIAATTHYAELKIYALSTAGVMNASCEFDIETLRPTYRLLIGVPGKSNAFAISSKLGLSESIIDDAKARLTGQSKAFEDVLSGLEEKRRELEASKDAAVINLRRAEQSAAEAEKYRASYEKKANEAQKLARREAEKIISEARKTAELVFAELDDLKKKQTEDVQKLNDEKADIYQILNKASDELYAQEEPEIAPETAPVEDRPIVIGDTVKLLTFGTTATVTGINPNGTYKLAAGSLTINAKPSEIALTAEKQKQKSTARHNSKIELRKESVRPELDLRGMMTDEAVDVLEHYLDNAKLSKLESVTIIHGKGTGALRTAVHQALRREKGIKRFRLGTFGEGESGVTIVEFK